MPVKKANTFLLYTHVFQTGLRCSVNTLMSTKNTPATFFSKLNSI